VLGRDLTYQMPFERLAKLSRSASRKAFATTWRSTWLLIGAYFGLLAVLVVFNDEINRLERDFGIPWWLWLVLLISAAFIGLFVVRRRWRGLLKKRVDFDSTVNLREEPDGLRFATPQIEYYVKWKGISQVLMEHDGVVISHGALFFMVPDEAFTGRPERDAFVRDIFSRLSDAARERSEKFVRSVIDAAPSTTGA
jgi:hypothetical protein